MGKFYIVCTITRYKEDEERDRKYFKDVNDAIKCYHDEIRKLKEQGGIIYDIQSYGYKEKDDFEINENNYSFSMYEYQGDYEASVYIIENDLE